MMSVSAYLTLEPFLRFTTSAKSMTNVNLDPQCD
jgi:hypothetical protein